MSYAINGATKQFPPTNHTTLPYNYNNSYFPLRSFSIPRIYILICTIIKSQTVIERHIIIVNQQIREKLNKPSFKVLGFVNFKFDLLFFNFAERCYVNVGEGKNIH